jgi:hypothetical protein
MSNYNTQLQSNNLDLQTVLQSLQNKAAGGSGVELPELISPAGVDEVFSGKEYIDGTGEKKTGTFTIDNELNAQDNVINQIMTALEGKAAGGGSGSGVTIETVTGTVGASGPEMLLSGIVHYMDANGTYATSNTAGTILVMKDSILFADSGDSVKVGGGTVLIYAGGTGKVYRITDDFNIKV